MSTPGAGEAFLEGMPHPYIGTCRHMDDSGAVIGLDRHPARHKYLTKPRETPKRTWLSDRVQPALENNENRQTTGGGRSIKRREFTGCLTFPPGG